jgi:hypothetical protein
MSDTQTIPEGQVEPDTTSAVGTTETTPEGGDGQVVGDGGTSETHSDTSKGEVFFDHGAFQESIKDAPPEQKTMLEAAFKQMQGAFTKRMQGLSKESEKLNAYNAFMSNPMEQIQRLATQHGYQLVQNNGQNVQNQPDNTGRDWDANPPQTWKEVEDRITESAVSRAMKEFQSNLQPIMSNVQNLTTNNIETQLNGIDPNWRVYEDAMKETLSKHPTLVSDVSTLYRLSVPPEIMESKAVQKAIKKMEEKGKAAHSGVKSTSVKTKPATQQVNSFEDAVRVARAQLTQ